MNCHHIGVRPAKFIRKVANASGCVDKDLGNVKIDGGDDADEAGVPKVAKQPRKPTPEEVAEHIRRISHIGTGVKFVYTAGGRKTRTQHNTMMDPQEYQSSDGIMRFLGIMCIQRVRNADHCWCNTIGRISMYSRTALKEKVKTRTRLRELNKT